MSRRARQRQHHPRRVSANALQIAIKGVSLLSHDDVEGQVALMNQAAAEFSRGQHCERHWLSLADTANMAETMAAMGLGSGPDADRVIEDAQRALGAVHQRHAERGTWTLWADEIEALGWLVRLHTTQLRACSYREFELAFHRTAERLAQARAGNAPAGAIVVVGQLGNEAGVPMAAG